MLDLAGVGLHPFLAWRLAQHDRVVPDEARRRLEMARRASSMVLAYRREGLRRVFEALDHAGVPFVVLKGFALAYRAYPSPELRTMSDVDLWLNGGDLGAAMALLAPLGWKLPWWHRGDGRYMEDGITVGVRHGSGPLMLELHRSPASFDVLTGPQREAIWSRRVEADLGGRTALVLSDVDALLHVCLHLACHHRFVAGVPRLLDIAMLVQRRLDDASWPAIVRRSGDLGIAGWIATALGTARDMLGARVPEGALASFDVQDLPRLRAMARAQVWSSPRAGMTPLSILAAPTARERFGRAAARLRELMVPPGQPDASVSQRLGRLLRRLTYAAGYIIPAFVRTMWRGTFRGENGARLRALSAENEELAVAMRERSAIR